MGQNQALRNKAKNKQKRQVGSKEQETQVKQVGYLATEVARGKTKHSGLYLNSNLKTLEDFKQMSEIIRPMTSK